MMDPSDEIVTDAVDVPEPIASAIHPVDVESVEVEEAIEYEEKSQDPNQGNLKSKFTSGFKKVNPFGKSATAADKITSTDGETTQQQQELDTQDTSSKSNKFTSGFKNVLSFGKSAAGLDNNKEMQQDGETTQQQLDDGQQVDPNANKFTSGIKSVFSFGSKSEPADANPNESSTNPASTTSSSWTDGIKGILPFKKTPGQNGNPIEMLTNAAGDAEANVANSSANGTANSPPGATTTTTGSRVPNGATAPQQDADFTIISDGFNNKKTLANGLMDFAFLTANANQLHYALASRAFNVDRVISIALISASIFLQIIAGILLITGSYIQAKPIPINRSTGANTNASVSAYLQWRARVMNLIDHWTIALVFMIAIINIFIAAFATGTSGSSTTTETTPTQTTSTTTAAAAFILKKFF